LLDDLARARADLSHRRATMSERETRVCADNVAALVKQRCPPAWKSLPQLHSALGVTWFELNQLEASREAFLAAIRAEDEQGVVPIRDIERLANVEARLGERRAEAEIGSGRGKEVSVRAAEALIDLALERLDGLDALVGAAVKGHPDDAGVASVNSVRSALRGSAWKRKASLQARRLLTGRLTQADADRARDEMMMFLGKAIDAYRSAEGSPGSSHFVPYLSLNRLALDALTEWGSPAIRDAAIALAQQCRQSADLEFSDESGTWGAVTQPESMLVEHLIKGSLGRADDTGRVIFEEIAKAYADATNNITVKPSQIDSIVSQMDLISRFCDALSQGPAGSEAMALTADRLTELARRILPGRTPRSDRPRRAPAAAPAPAAVKAPAKSPARAAAKKRAAATKPVAAPPPVARKRGAAKKLPRKR